MKHALVVGAALAVLALAGQAAAANYQVMLGEQQPCGFAPCKGAGAGVPKGTTLDMFLPGAVTINAGDTITFSSASFHTVSYGPKPPALLMPDPAKGKYASLADAAGTPFFFTGLPKLIYNGQAFGPFGSNVISGPAPSSSGALSPAGPKAKPATFTYSFPKAGTYKLFCSIHPGMTAKVTVKPAGTPVPMSPAQVQAAGLAAVDAAWLKIKAVAKASKPAAATVYMGYGSGPTVLGYLPQTVRVKAGTTVNFVNKAANEVHNIVFGPKKYILGVEKKTDLLPQGPKAPNQVAPFLVFGSDPKGHQTYDGTNHGNGFFATPLTAGFGGTPLPRSTKVTFTKAGTYKFFCWIHGPDMSGTVIVTK